MATEQPSIDVSEVSASVETRKTLELDNTISNVVLSPLSNTRRLSTRGSTCLMPANLPQGGAGGSGASPSRRTSTLMLAGRQTAAAAAAGGSALATNAAAGDRSTVAARVTRIAPGTAGGHDDYSDQAPLESLEGQMTNEHLMTLQRIFNETNENGRGGLDMEEFRVALKKTMGRDVDDRELDKMFMKVDTNCDGTVDMDEYLTYMLLEYQEKQSMVSIDQEHPVPDQITPIRSSHGDSIVCIAKMQGIRSQPGAVGSMPEYDEQATRYFSLSKEGTLSVFNTEWSLQRTAMLEGAKSRANDGTNSNAKTQNQSRQKNWFTDFTCMSNCNMIAVGSTEYEVVFYSVSGSMLKKKLAITQLADCALTLDFRYDYHKNECALVWGDTHGRITLVRFPDLSDPTALFACSQSTQKSKSVTSNVCAVPIQKIIDGEFDGVVCASFVVHGGDWVRQVKFFNQTSEESSSWQVVSCSVADDKALVFSEYQVQSRNKYSEESRHTPSARATKPRVQSAPKRVTNAFNKAAHQVMDEIHSQVGQKVPGVHAVATKLKKSRKQGSLEIVDKLISEFHLRKGILCFDFDTNENLIVTGSRDCDIRVWNPYVVTKSSTLLKGHKASVTHIMVNSVEHQAVSISADKNIRLWDLKDFTCRQSIHGRNLSLGRMPISAAYLNTRSREIVLGTHSLGMLEPKNTVATSNRCIVSHSRAVTAVLYNPLFDEIVTSSEDSMVGVWDIRTGQKQMLFTVEKDVETTALSFDSTGRRLITGSRNGKTRVWNFNNGACLRTLHSEDNVEVSSIICPKQYIMTAGWNKKLTAFIDSYTDDTSRHFKCRHHDDILALAYHSSENILASSSYDGDILVWSLETEDAVLRFNVYKSVSPLPLGEIITHTKGGQRNVKQSRKDLMKNINNVMKNKGSTQSEAGTERAVYALLMLDARKVREKTAILLSAGVNSFVQAWSIHQRGGLVGRFMAGSKSDESILALATNKDNSILITGDSCGYLKIFDISNYCLQKDSFKPTASQHDIRRGSSISINLMSSMAVAKKRLLRGVRDRLNNNAVPDGFGNDRRQSLSRRPSMNLRRASISLAAFHSSLGAKGNSADDDDSTEPEPCMPRTGRRASKLGDALRQPRGSRLNPNPSAVRKTGSNVDVLNMVNMQPPPLITSFRAHTKAITSIAVNESRNIMITGSTDCSVRIWTMCGRYVGTLGQKMCWGLDEGTLDLSRLPQIIPEDVRRVASANTLRTVKGGVHTQWKMVKNALAFLQHKPEPEKVAVVEATQKVPDTLASALVKEKPNNTPQRTEDGKEKDEDKEGEDSNSLGAILRRPSMKIKRRPSVTTIWMDDQPMKTIMEFQAQDKVEQTYQKILDKGITSTILGKHGWKKKYRRERAPLAANYERLNAPGEGPRPPLAPVAQLSLADKTNDVFTVLKHNPVRWEAKHAIVYSRLPFATLDTPTVPVISSSIRKELSSNAVKRWQDGNFEQQIRMSATSHGDADRNYGAEKLLRLANRAKQVQRASKILKQRITTSRTNLKVLNSELGLAGIREEGPSSGDGRPSAHIPSQQKHSSIRFAFDTKGGKNKFGSTLRLPPL